MSRFWVIYIDGQRFGEHHIVSALGVDMEGQKHVLGIESGATENANTVKRLLTHLQDHGLAPAIASICLSSMAERHCEPPIDEVFGAEQPVQRCRNHKLRNVMAELPDEQHSQALNLMRAAWKTHTAEEGEKRIEQLARFLEYEYEHAARSLREGLSEMFTLQRLQIPPSLYRSLGTTNFIESSQSGLRRRTAKVSRWRDAAMVERWSASAWLLTEQHFNRIGGHKDLWALATILGRAPANQTVCNKEGIA